MTMTLSETSYMYLAEYLTQFGGGSASIHIGIGGVSLSGQGGSIILNVGEKSRTMELTNLRQTRGWSGFYSREGEISCTSK